MGNDPSTAGTTVNFSTLLKSGVKIKVSTAKDILPRLNINYVADDNDNDDDDDDNNDKKNNNVYNNDIEKYLDEYLDKLSDNELNELFRSFGVIFDITDNDKKKKIESLLLISSKDYWIKNYLHHPLHKRVKNWLFVHQKYRNYISEIINASSTDLKNARHLFNKFDKKLSGHTHFEDNMLFKYFNENLNDDIILKNVLKELSNDHNDIVPKLRNKLIKCNDLVEFQSLIKEYQTHINNHLQKEEENIIHIWLNLSDQQYKKYRTYLSWKYAAVY